MKARPEASASAKIGQLMIVGFDGTRMTRRFSSLLMRIQPAGVILFARNIASLNQVRDLLRDCQECVSSQMFACVDLEGGTVDRLRGIVGPAPSPLDVFATGDRALFRKHGRLIGENCRSFGFNVDFAPVLDLAFEASRKVMSSRAVSAKPREVAAYAREFLTGLRAAGVLGCGKHFPGLGEGKLDSHFNLPVIDKSLKELWTEDLLPYRLLRGRLPMVMISHAAYPQITNDHTPASLSRVWITEVLRKRIGYRNLIVSDDLEMGGVLVAAPIRLAAVDFVRAGGDLCLICHRQDRIEEAYNAMVAAAERDEIFKRRVREAVRRIEAFKKRFTKRLSMTKSSSRTTNTEVVSRRLWEFSEQVRLSYAENNKRKMQARSRA